jgi:isocitrate dehydrogenase
MTGNKVEVKGTLVELDGDEMTRVMWKMVKEKLLTPYLDMKIEYFDLGLPNRDKTNDKVTLEAAEAIKRHGVGVKCATITPNKDRIKEYNLKKEWPSPNGTLRAALDGTIFRSPILVSNVQPTVKAWKKPIHIGRHAYGDVYENQEIRVDGAGKAELVFTPAGGSPPIRRLIHEFDGPGILQGIHNTDDSIRKFAKACFTYALDRRVDLWFSDKDTISKTYDSRFTQIFKEEFENWKAEFEQAHITYFFTLIDDAVARIMRSEGGILWACKNYDGDVQSDTVAQGYGSLGLMTSVLMSPDGRTVEAEAAHGTVTRHYRMHQQGKPTSTNPIASIFAWTRGLQYRGKIDGTPDVEAFATTLEQVCIDVVESGKMTKDLAILIGPKQPHLATEDFMNEIDAELKRRLS